MAYLTDGDQLDQAPTPMGERFRAALALMQRQSAPAVAATPSATMTDPRPIPALSQASLTPQGSSLVDAKMASPLAGLPALKNPDVRPALFGAPAPGLLPVSDPQLTKAAQTTNGRLLGDQAELQRVQSSGSGISQIQNPFLRGLANVGQGIEQVLLPGFASRTPGTELNHQRILSQDQGRIGADLSQGQQIAQTGLLDAQPQLKSQALENQVLKTQGNIQHQSDMLDLGQQKLKQQTDANLRNHGYTLDETDPSGQKVRPLRYDEMSESQQAVEDLKHSQAEFADANAALKKAQNDPSSPAFKIAKQRVDVAQQNANTALQKLSLQGQSLEMARERLGMQEDKQYNPQPTATQRTKGDLAQSAVERIAEMRAVVAKHPEYFGPVAGRMQNAQAWLGSSDPDAVTYNTAAQYLADHSAGVFGGRGQYITQALHGITDPHYTPEGLNAALDEAERSAKGFVDAGRIHQKGERSGYNSSQQNSVGIPDAAASQLQEGVIHTFGNGQQWTKTNGKPVRIK